MHFIQFQSLLMHPPRTLTQRTAIEGLKIALTNGVTTGWHVMEVDLIYIEMIWYNFLTTVCAPVPFLHDVTRWESPSAGFSQKPHQARRDASSFRSCYRAFLLLFLKCSPDAGNKTANQITHRQKEKDRETEHGENPEDETGAVSWHIRQTALTPWSGLEIAGVEVCSAK